MNKSSAKGIKVSMGYSEGIILQSWDLDEFIFVFFLKYSNTVNNIFNMLIS
jgi:hypothetical protein